MKERLLTSGSGLTLQFPPAPPTSSTSPFARQSIRLIQRDVHIEVRRINDLRGKNVKLQPISQAEDPGSSIVLDRVAVGAAD